VSLAFGRQLRAAGIAQSMVGRVPARPGVIARPVTSSTRHINAIKCSAFLAREPEDLHRVLLAEAKKVAAF
jgi:hypothetical protein